MQKELQLNIKRLSLLNLVAVILAGLTALSVYLMYGSLKTIEAETKVRYQSYILAEQVRQSSDQLSLMARAYTVTGNTKFLDFFNQILAIRNGEAPRPEDYHRVYWDMLMPHNGKAPFPDGEKKSLQVMLNSIGITDEEMQQIRLAEKASNDLTKIEYAAFQALANKPDENMEKEQIDAILSLYSDDYFLAKSEIMSHINNFLFMLDYRTEQNLHTATRDHYLMSLFSFCCFITILIVLYFIGRLRKSLNHLYVSSLEAEVAEKTSSLTEKNVQLKESMDLMAKTQKYLMEAEKTAALGRLVVGVAHEVNTPVGICITAVSYLEDENKKMGKVLADKRVSKGSLEKYVHTSEEISLLLHSNLDRLVELITSFKQIAADQHCDELRLINLNPHLHDIVMSFKSDSKNKNVEVIFNIPDDLKIQSYPGTFNHVMTNLFSNVFFHAFDGQIEGAKIEVSASFKHNNVFISVKDNGCGISEDIQDKIFDPFFTTKRVQKNTGLGLYAVMNLVTQKLKGSISFESEEQTGTTFYLTLPNLQTEHEITQSDDIEPL